LAQAMADGAKYGRFEWREGEISARARYAAIRRHLADWAMGKDTDPDSGLPLLGLVMGGCAVLLDAKAHGCLNDDRAAPVQAAPVKAKG